MALNYEAMATPRIRKTSQQPPLAKREVAQPRGDAFVRTVLEITLTQLAQQGFERLSIPQIAQQAGVNKTSIYRRWLSKEELVRDALRVVVSPVDELPDTGQLRGDLVALAHKAAAFMQSQVGTAVIRILLAEGSNPQVSALASMAYQEAGRQGPWQVLARAMQRGELKSGIDPSLLLFTIAGALIHRVFVERQEATDAYIHQVVDMLLSGAAVEQNTTK